MDALREFKAAARLMCTAPFSQPNTSVYPFTGRNSCGHYPYLMRTSSWMACARSCQPSYLARAEGVSFKADSMADLATKKVESGGDRMRIICTSGRCSEDGSSHPDLFCGCGVSFLLTPSRLFRSATGCVQDYVETSVMLHYNHRQDNNVGVFELTTYNY